MKFSRIQGDSLWANVVCDPTSIMAIDEVWANWSGEWFVSGTTLSGTMARSATTGTFFLRIGSETVIGWSELPIGSYKLVTEVNNSTADYVHKETHTLNINGL